MNQSKMMLNKPYRVGKENNIVVKKTNFLFKPLFFRYHGSQVVRSLKLPTSCLSPSTDSLLIGPTIDFPGALRC